MYCVFSHLVFLQKMRILDNKQLKPKLQHVGTSPPPWVEGSPPGQSDGSYPKSHSHLPSASSLSHQKNPSLVRITDDFFERARRFEHFEHRQGKEAAGSSTGKMSQCAVSNYQVLQEIRRQRSQLDAGLATALRAKDEAELYALLDGLTER